MVAASSQCRVGVAVALVILGASTTRAGLAQPDPQFAPQALLGRPVETICRRLSALREPTRVSTRDLAEQKVTIITTQAVSVERLAAAVAALLQARWVERRTADGDTKEPIRLQLERLPEVIAELERQAREQAARDARAAAEQAHLLRKGLQRALRGLESGDTAGVIGYPDSPAAGSELARLVGTLSPAQLAAVCASPDFGERTGYGKLLPPQGSGLLLPFDRMSGTQQSLVRDFLRQAQPPDARVKLDPAGGVVGFANMEGNAIGVRLRFRSGRQLALPVIPADLSKAARERTRPMEAPYGPPPPQFGPQCPPDVVRSHPDPVTVDWPFLSADQVAVRLSEALGIPVLADFYSRPPIAPIQLKQVTAASLVSRVLKETQTVAAWHNGFLLLRTRDWPLQDSLEAPEALIERWAGVREAILANKNREQALSAELALLGDIASRLELRHLPRLAWSRSRLHPETGLGAEVMGLLESQNLALFRAYGRMTPSERRNFHRNGVNPTRLISPGARAAAFSLLQQRVPWVLDEAGNGVVLRLPVIPGAVPPSCAFQVVSQGTPPRLFLEERVPLPPLERRRRTSGSANSGRNAPTR